MRMICLLLLPLGSVFGGEGSYTHQTEMCRPPITRHDLYTLAMQGANSAILKMIEGHNGNKPVSFDQMVHISTTFSKLILATKSISFITRLMHIQCHLNKPGNSSETAEPAEEAFMCIWEKAAEKCYKYKDKKEGEIEPLMDVEAQRPTSGSG